MTLPLPPTPTPTPTPPAPKPYATSGLRIFDGIRRGGLDDHIVVAPPLSTLKARVADRFYWRTGRRHAAEIMAIECCSWRHGRDAEDFQVHVHADGAKAIRGLIVGRASAANLTTAVELRLPLRLDFEDEDIIGRSQLLVDGLKRRLRAQPVGN